MKAQQIRNALKQKKLNFVMVAEALNVSPALVSNAVHRRFRSRRVAEALAAAIGKPLYEVFPEYRAIDGSKAIREKQITDLREKLAKAK